MSSALEYEPLLTPAECATLFRVDAKTITRWAKAGKLSSIRTIGGHRRYKEKEIRALLSGESVTLLWPSAVTGAALTTRTLLVGAGIVTISMLTGNSARQLRERGLQASHVEQVRLALAKRGLALHGDVLAGKAA